MKKILALMLGLALAGAVAVAQPVVDGVINDGEYANTLTHSESETVLYWTVEGENLHMAFTMPARGWAGIGWNTEQTNRKAGFDVMIVTMQDGAPVILDMFQESARGEPVLDTDEGGSNSYTEFAASHVNDVWTVEFVRPLATGQDTDVDIVPGKSYVFMLAYANVMDPGRAHARSTAGGAFYIEDFKF